MHYRTRIGRMATDPCTPIFGPFLCLFLTLSVLGCGKQEEGKPPEGTQGSASFKKEFRAIWENATAYTLEVLDSMPADSLGVKPAKGSMSFRQQLLHIEGNLHGLSDRYILEKEAPSDPEHDKNASKRELRGRLKKAFQKVEKALNELSRKELRDTTELFERMQVPKTRVFFLMRDHMTHHRAQMIIALRKAGKTPPDYRGW